MSWSRRLGQFHAAVYRRLTDRFPTAAHYCDRVQRTPARLCLYKSRKQKEKDLLVRGERGRPSCRFVGGRFFCFALCGGCALNVTRVRVRKINTTQKRPAESGPRCGDAEPKRKRARKSEREREREKKKVKSRLSSCLLSDWRNRREAEGEDGEEEGGDDENP